MTIENESMGNLTNNTVSDNNYYPWPCYPQVQTYQWPYSTVYIDKIIEPTTCMGKAHVFECKHEPKCKCGQIERILKFDV
jgi:hypothetical protein